MYNDVDVGRTVTYVLRQLEEKSMKMKQERLRK